MSNYLSLQEACELANLSKEIFQEKYIDAGIISMSMIDGELKVELSEFFRVFPDTKHSMNHSDTDEAYLELQLKQMKIENLEYKVVNLERQLNKQSDEYNWLRTKFDRTTMLLEQKLDTSEIDKYRQEIQILNNQAIQWEKKYNTLLAANELKSVLRENRELKAQIVASQPTLSEQINKESDAIVPDEVSQLKSMIVELQQKLSPINNKSEEIPVNEEDYNIKPKRKKIFGIF